VIKPLDSQGQRGVYKVDSVEKIRSLFQDVLQYSREDEILVEEYYDSDEVTLSGWVYAGKVHILTITDRITIDNGQHIGICLAHEFPSKYLTSYFEDFRDITERIVETLGLNNGPIYFQMLVVAEGVKVNEIACRIGGAYEDELIPLLTGIDILDMLIDAAMGEKIDDSGLVNYNLLENKGYASVEMIFTKPGTIGFLPDMEKIKALPGVISGKFNYQVGSFVKEIENATQRVGYMILKGETREELRKYVNDAYKHLKIYNTDGKNMCMDVRQKVMQECSCLLQEDDL
jgi:biotin carboxylase